MKRTWSGLPARTAFQNTPTGIGRALYCFNHIEHAQLLWIERRGVTTQGTRIGPNPTSLDQRQHGVRQEARRGSNSFRQL